MVALLEAQGYKRSFNDWDTYFMHLAEDTAQRSKDPNTKVGACFVKDKRVLSLGYNGAPSGFPDEEVPITHSDNILLNKSSYMCHAELNAILNFRGNLTELKGSTVYVTLSPCHDCMKAMAQIGVKEIIYRDTFHKADVINLAFLIGTKCGINIRKLGEDNAN